MKQKTNNLYLAFLIGLMSVLPASCDKDDIEEAALAFTPPHGIEFESNAGQTTLTVACNRQQWTAFSPAEGEWITLSRMGNTLEVKADENKLTEERETLIVFMYGKENKTLEVKQSGAEKILQTGSFDTQFAQWAETRIINVRTNTQDWEVESDSPNWLKVKAKPLKKEVVVSVLQNISREPRTGKLRLKTGDKVQELEITQQGILYHIMPLLEGNKADVRKFELARRSYFDTRWGGGIFIYITQSPFFPEIRYYFDDNGNVKAADLYSLQREKGEEMEKEFEKIAQKAGYELYRKTPYTSTVYINREKRIKLRFIRDSEESGAYIMFDIQPKDMPTLKKLPYIDELEFNKSAYSHIIDYEKRHGNNNGEWLPKFTVPERGYFCFDVKDARHPACINRLYWLSKDENKLLNAHEHYFNDQSLVTYDGELLTIEFEDMMQKEGFIYLGFNPKGKNDQYYHPGRELVLLLNIRPSYSMDIPYEGPAFRIYQRHQKIDLSQAGIKTPKKRGESVPAHTNKIPYKQSQK